MKIASIVTNGNENGDHLIIVSRKEAQDINNVFTTYCEEHKRKTNAKKLLKQFGDNFQIWG